ncbi:MAG: hypothetical protein ACLFVL_01565 [Candidatus Aenigmatarchaeota archaeon]
MKGKNEKIGFGLLALGIALLLLTFYLAMNAFLNPGSIAQFKELVPGTTGGEEFSEAMAQLVSVLVYIVAAILLWVMGSIGGRITMHGIKMLEVPEMKKKDSETSPSPKRSTQPEEQSQGKEMKAKSDSTSPPE